jgi:hypothetical protein
MFAGRRLVAAALCLSFAGAACAKSNPIASQGTPTPTPRATASASPVPSSVATSPTPSASPALADGRSYGYIKSVDATNKELVFDLAQFFSGDAANKAAQEDGVIGPGESVDNDYYIRNVNPKLRIIPIAPTVIIEIIQWSNCCEHTLKPTLTTFAKAFPGPGPTDDFHGLDSSYWLTVKNGAIVKIEEQYLP